MTYSQYEIIICQAFIRTVFGCYPEVFLLDTEGNILAHAFPPESIVQNRVDLSPVKALIGGDVEMPLRGTDPRNLDREKIFSASLD